MQVNVGRTERLVRIAVGLALAGTGGPDAALDRRGRPLSGLSPVWPEYRCAAHTGVNQS